jgi:hypothetical protein
VRAISGATTVRSTLSCIAIACVSCTIAGPTPAPKRSHPSWPSLQPSSPSTTAWTDDATEASYDSPTLMSSTPHAVVPGYNSRVVGIRTSLGRAAIQLEMRSAARKTIRSSACGDPSPVQTGCSVCVLAGETDDLDSAVLDAILVAFNRYPADVLEATHIEKVALCSKLSYEDIPDRGTVGTVDLKERRLIVSLAPFLGEQYDASGPQTTEDIIHHELFHLFEYERMHANYIDDPWWRLWNPLGFEYTDSGGTEKTDRPFGFVDPYAATNEIEDKASVYQFMMARPAELCDLEKIDPTVRKKVSVIWERIDALTDDTFLKNRARCANLD